MVSGGSSPELFCYTVAKTFNRPNVRILIVVQRIFKEGYCALLSDVHLHCLHVQRLLTA